MASTLKTNDVDRIATLARLALTPEERNRFATQLSDVLQYVAQISTIDTTGVVATSHPLAAGDAWRDDQPDHTHHHRARAGQLSTRARGPYRFSVIGPRASKEIVRASCRERVYLCV